MAGRILATDVHVPGVIGATLYPAGTVETEELTELIPNPKAWVTLPGTVEPIPAAEASPSVGGEYVPLVAPYTGKVDDLKAELVHRGLDIEGKKDDLIARLEADDRDKAAGGSDNTEE
ncbi:SAP domain-containing protein [Rathayibacter sp. Leaf248]|uniref:SAP domain-containing protein n=1 Tax=Rathayibacter sp. Leaf248 TaxID=2876555 RepID=UPI001E38A315|nr:SAP domain-containing protein [Rathayibacter sp. Leaf248]